MSWLPELSSHLSSQHLESSKKQLMRKPSKILPKINSRKLSNIGRNVVTGRNVSEIIPSHTGSLVPRPFTLNGMFRQSNGNKETHSKLKSSTGTNNNNNTNNSTLTHSTVEKKSRNRSSISIRTPINVSVQENKTSNTRNRLPSISMPKRANVIFEGNNSTLEKKSNNANSHETSNTINRLPSILTPNRGNRNSIVQESKISYQSLANRARQFLERAGKKK
jgi:hypothetical protein